MSWLVTELSLICLPVIISAAVAPAPAVTMRAMAATITTSAVRGVGNMGISW